MSFTLEDGTGVAGANAYLASAAAETYWTDRSYDFTGPVIQFENAIVRATQYLDGVYGERFIGRKYTREQGLEWPRYAAYDHNGFLLPVDEVPELVKFATAELALKIAMDSTVLLPDVAADEAARKTVDVIGPIRTERTYSDPVGDRDPIFKLVEAILSPVIVGEAEIELVRA